MESMSLFLPVDSKGKSDPHMWTMSHVTKDAPGAARESAWAQVLSAAGP